MDDVVVAGGEAVSRAADGEGMASQHQEWQDGGEYGLEHGERLCFADLIFAIDIRYLMGRGRRDIRSACFYKIKSRPSLNY